MIVDAINTGDEEVNASLPSFAEALAAYIDEQGPVAAAMRREAMPAHPWPEESNPLLAYLSVRATEILREEGPDAAIIWLAVHAWFEGASAIASRHRPPEGTNALIFGL